MDWNNEIKEQMRQIRCGKISIKIIAAKGYSHDKFCTQLTLLDENIPKCIQLKMPGIQYIPGIPGTVTILGEQYYKVHCVCTLGWVNLYQKFEN